MTKHTTRLVASALILSLIAGCATAPSGGGMRQAGNPPPPASASDDPCSVGSSALAGAVAGALLGALIDGKRGAVKGAAVGGIAGAIGCVAINSQSRQTKTAAQSDKEYVTARGALPPEPQVVSYVQRLSNNVVQRGQPMRINTTVELVNGSKTQITEVREELVVYDTHGEPFKTKAKPLTNRSGGRFENSFELSLPEQAPQGTYTLKTNLYINNKLMARRDMSTQVVWDGKTAVQVAAL